MEEYTYEIQVRKGTLHTNADGMSRLPCNKKVCICSGVADLEKLQGLQDSGVEQALLSMIKFSPVYTAEEMAAAQLADLDIRPLYVAKIVNQIRYARHGMKSAVNRLQQRRTWQSGRE